MKKLILPIYVICVFASCAVTKTAPDYCHTNIIRKEPATVIIDSDTIYFDNDQKSKLIELKRSSEEKSIILIRDTSIDSIPLRPTLGNERVNYVFKTDIGHIADQDSPEKWQYPKQVFLSESHVNSSSGEMKGFDAYKPCKGSIYLRSNILFPVINWFNYTNEENESLSRLGFGFWNLGVDYYYKSNMFINLTVGEAYDLKLPATLSYGFGGRDSEKIQILYVSLSNNHLIGKFELGYGISYGYDRWKFKEDTEDPQSNSYNVSRLYFQSLGLVFPAHYQTNSGFYFGLIYRPMLVQFSEKIRFQYQHTLSIDLGWRIRLKK